MLLSIFFFNFYGIDYLQHSDHNVHVELTLTMLLHPVLYALWYNLLQYQSFLFAHWLGSFLHRVKMCCVTNRKLCQVIARSTKSIQKFPSGLFETILKFRMINFSTRIYALALIHNYVLFLRPVHTTFNLHKALCLKFSSRSIQYLWPA